MRIKFWLVMSFTIWPKTFTQHNISYDFFLKKKLKIDS